MSELDVEKFFSDLEEDSVPEYEDKDRVTKIYMNNPDDQGTIIIVPFLNTKNDKVYYKLSNVKEWIGSASGYSTFEKVAFKVLPEKEYGVLSEENSMLLAEVNKLFDSIKESDLVNYDKIRIRRYTLIYGVLVSHRGVDTKLITKNIDKPCLFVFPSHKPINALTLAAQAKQDLIGGNSKLWVTDIINSKTVNRSGVISITFKRSGGNSKGYDSAVSFELNAINPGKTFDENITKYFADPVRDWLGWQGIKDSPEYFNPEVMSELRDILSLENRRVHERIEAGDKPKATKLVNENVVGVNGSTVGRPVLSEITSDLPF